MGLITFETENETAYVTLNNPKAFNTLSLSLMKELDAVLQQIGEERAAKVVVIQGNEKAFSAGHSLHEFDESTQQEVNHIFRVAYKLMRTIREIPQLVISKVHGVAVAAGTQIVAISDLAIASDKARFATPGINSGLFCSTPAVFLSRNVGRKKAAELLFTGNLMGAEEALEHGLVNKVVPLEKLDEATESMVQDITKQSLDIIEIGKRQFYEQLQMSDFEALNYAVEVISANTKHPDALEGIQAFFDKRKPEWPSDQ